MNALIQCNPSTGFAEYVAGNVDNTTAWMGIVPSGGWYDFTQYIEDSEKLSFTWDKINSGDSSNSITNQDGSNYDKGITAELMFFDHAHAFIKDWLLSTECSILNAIEVKIIDLIARDQQADPEGNYRIFEIKSDNIDYAPIDEPCQFHIKLREQDMNWHCIHKTFIWDNWQHWFEDSTVKSHPCFLTCIEPRPRLVQSARMALLMFFHSLIDIIYLFTGPVGLIIKNWINSFTAEDLREHARRILNANRFVDAPLVRTYIDNVAGKCNLTTDTIFDVGQPWENACIYFPQAGYMHEFDGDEKASPSLAYHFDNRWLITIAELLDKLKVVYAAEWYVTPLDTLVFKHKKDLITLAPIYDFTAPGAEPIYNLRYTFNGDKKPAYGRYEYQDDGSDLASQEMSTLYSDIIDYDGPSNNPMLEGERLKSFEFAPTGFVRDGRSKDYLRLLIEDGKLGAFIITIILAVVLVAFVAGAITVLGAIAMFAFFYGTIGAIVINNRRLRDEFVDGPAYDGVVRLTSEQTMIPRLLLWDGVSEEQAKVVKTVVLPDANLFYNPLNISYDVKNRIEQDNPEPTIYNYPLYFDGDFMDNMFPNYHDTIDNPLKSLESHQDVKWSVDLCPPMLNLFGVFENQYAQIGKIVKLETRDNYDVYVRIGNISVDYDTNQINLRGVVLRRQFVTEARGVPGSGAPIEESSGFARPDFCLRWINNGVTTAVGVRYMDCDGIEVTADIAVNERFCAIEILDLGTGGNIQGTDSCEVVESGESSGSGGVVDTSECNKIYVANFIENEGLDPTVIVYENSLGDIVWTRIGVGAYRGTLVGMFPLLRTWFEGSTPIAIGQGQITYFITLSEDYLEINTYDGAGANSDAVLGEAIASFEIRTYCSTVDAGLDQVICVDDSGGVQLAGFIGGPSPIGTWSTSGDGTFDNVNLLNAVYYPGAADILAGTVTLTLTTDDPIGVPGPASDSMVITIDASAPIGTFDYTDPQASSQYCQALPSNPSPLGNPSPNFTGGGIGGVFTADAGLVFVGGSPSATGQVDIEATPPGVYTVTNTVTNGCGITVETAEIEILELPAETISYSPDSFCNDAGLQDVILADGSFLAIEFTASPAGLTIDSTTGQIDPSTSIPGTYTVTFVYTSFTCPNSTTTQVTVEPCVGLRLLFGDIAAADALVGDSSSVSDWNTFFDMGVRASSPFTSLVITGNEVLLIGAVGMTIKDSAFTSSTDILSVIDEVNCVIGVGVEVFLLASSLQTVTLPAATGVDIGGFRSTSGLVNLTMPNLVIALDDAFHDATGVAVYDFQFLTDAGANCFMGCNATQYIMPQLVNIGTNCFNQCTGVTDFDLSSCTNLGGTTGDDFVFFNTTGETITLTVPTATGTDGDVVYLQANNTVTLNLV